MSDESMSFREKALTIGVIGKRTKSIVLDGLDDNGERYKSVTDELGNTVTEYTDRQNVTICPQSAACTLKRN